MIHYRPFRNCDPPDLAAIWCSQPAARGRVQTMTAAILDDLVLAKPYFESAGLIVAVDDNEGPLGFGHAGFGCRADGMALDHQTGVVCQLLVKPGSGDAAEIARGLLAECEAYLRQRGAQVLYGGGTNELAPFYLGLYGGARLPGVLASDSALRGVFEESGYSATPACTVFERSLAGFRPAVDRELMKLRRQHQVVATDVSLPVSWWDACHWGPRSSTAFTIEGYPTSSVATFWDVEPLASSWGAHAMGLWELELPDESMRPVLAAYLLGESLRELQKQGISLVEGQASHDDGELQETFGRLGFQQVDEGLLFVKRD